MLQIGRSFSLKLLRIRQFKTVKYFSNHCRYLINRSLLRNTTNCIFSECMLSSTCKFFSISSFRGSKQIAIQKLVDANTFEKVCDETLESLTEYFEELAEALESADVTYSSGVLTVNLGDKYGTYVINRQSPNRQIWLSSPVSGPKRYDYVVDGSYWVYKHDSKSLHELLQEEISKFLKNVDFSKCSYAKL